MQAPASSSLAAGTLLDGKLTVVRRLGEGGMGAVYEVLHQVTKHHRAIKVLHPDAGKKPDLVERFFREASAAGRIGNPHIVETFDAGTLSGGEPYLVMELLAGETLAQRLEKGPLTLAELGDTALQICNGVEAAHQAGIIHRDLKPENLFITSRDDRPFLKILDFGVSKFAQTESVRSVTQEGYIVGTPYYMSSEQLAGKAGIDARADIYALGIIFYECATGKKPFNGTTLPELAVAIHEGKPAPLRGLRPELPAAFVATVMRAMHREAEERYSSTRELADAISASLGLNQEAKRPSIDTAAATFVSDAPPALPSTSPSSSSEAALSHSKLEVPLKKSRIWVAVLSVGLFGLGLAALSVLRRDEVALSGLPGASHDLGANSALSLGATLPLSGVASAATLVPPALSPLTSDVTAPGTTSTGLPTTAQPAGETASAPRHSRTARETSEAAKAVASGPGARGQGAAIPRVSPASAASQPAPGRANNLGLETDNPFR